MKLCVVLRVHKTTRVRGVEPPTWTIQEATLEVEPPELEPHLHSDDRTDTHWPIRVGNIRLCIPLSLVQETLPFPGVEPHPLHAAALAEASGLHSSDDGATNTPPESLPAS